MKIHRYRLRPGVKDIPESLPGKRTEPLSNDGSITISVEIPSRRENIDPESEYFDLDYFIVLDEDFGQPYGPFYDWVNIGHKIEGKYQEQIINRYNEVMDNVNWLVRDESLEKECEYAEDPQPPMTLYEFNRQQYDKIVPRNSEELIEVSKNLRNFIQQELDSKYAMLLCRELNDYTIFVKDTLIALEKSAINIMDILESRGPILDLHFNKENHYMECWVRHREDHKPHMYILFDCYDFVVKY